MHPLPEVRIVRRPALEITARVIAFAGFAWELIWMREWWQHVAAGHGTPLTKLYLLETVLLSAIIFGTIWLSAGKRWMKVSIAAVSALFVTSIIGGFSIGGAVLPGAFALMTAICFAAVRDPLSIEAVAAAVAIGAGSQLVIMFAPFLLA